LEEKSKSLKKQNNRGHRGENKKSYLLKSRDFRGGGGTHGELHTADDRQDRGHLRPEREKVKRLWSPGLCRFNWLKRKEMSARNLTVPACIPTLPGCKQGVTKNHKKPMDSEKSERAKKREKPAKEGKTGQYNIELWGGYRPCWGGRHSDRGRNPQLLKIAIHRPRSGRGPRGGKVSKEMG